MDFSHEVFLKNIAQTTGSPFLIDVERAEGIYLYSPSGKRYIDLISGIAVSNVGHGHPKVIRAVKAQVEKHLHVMVYGEFVQASPNRLAHKLKSVLPDGLDCVYFTNSGTEANEGALKLAKRVTGRTELVAFRGAYHGSTHGSLSVSGNEKKKYAFRPLLPDVRFLRFNVTEELDRITKRTAAVIIEPIQGDAGVRIPDASYMKALRKRCDDTGALLICDEIQSGMGRTGKWFAFEHFDIIPDIITVAKAFGGGLPLGAFISTYANMEQLTHSPMLGHITTFGGNPVSCAASLASIEIIEEVMDNIEQKGRLFEELLQHPKIIEIRRRGLMFAIEFSSEDEVYQIVREGISRGVICFWFLSTPTSFRIAPPLTISNDEIKESCQLLLDAINTL